MFLQHRNAKTVTTHNLADNNNLKQHQTISNNLKLLSLQKNYSSMKATISIIVALLFSVSLFAISPVKVYNKTSVYSSDVICNLSNSKVYKKNSVYSSDVVCNIRENKIYKANSVYSSDVIYTIRDGKVYKGNSVYTSDILMTIRDGKIYKGTSVYSSDVIATVRDGKVYKSNSVYTSDIMFHFDGALTLVEFVAVWYAVMYAW